MRSFGALVFALLAAGSVHAQAPASSDEAEASEGVPPTTVKDASLDGLDSPEMTSAQAYALGAQMFEAERFAEAEQAWLRAYELDPQPKLLIAIAETRARRDDEPGTVEMLEKYLAESPEAPDRVSVEAQIATLLQTPATLIVRSAEEGNPILVDGVPVARTTPAEIEIRARPPYRRRRGRWTAGW